MLFDIVNKIFFYFRNINSDFLNKICIIIRDDIKVDVVLIIDIKNILVYIGVGKEYYNIGYEIIIEVIKEVINNDKIIIRNNGL